MRNNTILALTLTAVRDAGFTPLLTQGGKHLKVRWIDRHGRSHLAIISKTPSRLPPDRFVGDGIRTRPSPHFLRPERETNTMSDDAERPKSGDEIPATRTTTDDTIVTKPKLIVVGEEELDADEAEFRALRQDVPGVQGASEIGIVTIGVAKDPGKNMFFRTHPKFHPVVGVVDLEVGMEKQFFAVSKSMEVALTGIGISISPHTLYLTVTSTGAVRIIPVRSANADGEQNEYNRTKEIGLRDGMSKWVRLYTDRENSCYRVYPALSIATPRRFGRN